MRNLNLTFTKKSALLFGFMFLAICATSQPAAFTISGKVEASSGAEKIILMGEVNEVLTLTKEKTFSFSGTVPGPCMLLVKTDSSFAYGIWITGGHTQVLLNEYDAASTKGATRKLLRVGSITGSAETEKNQWFVDYRNELIRRYQQLTPDQRSDSVEKYYAAVLEEYIRVHPQSKLSAHLINFSQLNTSSKENLLAILNRNVNAAAAEYIENALARETLLRTGNRAPDFQQSLEDGTLFTLYELSRKFTLLEFWSSDCLPCRRANPQLVQLYEKYHSKGFEIVGISKDKSKSAWLKAVKKDRLPWINVSDLRGESNTASIAYKVREVPYNVLLDKDYKVVATNLHVKDLSSLLQNLFKEKN